MIRSPGFSAGLDFRYVGLECFKFFGDGARDRFKRFLVIWPVLAELIEAQNERPGENQQQADRRENDDQRAQSARNVPLLEPVHDWIEKIRHENGDDQSDQDRRGPVTKGNHDARRDDSRAY